MLSVWGEQSRSLGGMKLSRKGENKGGALCLNLEFLCFKGGESPTGKVVRKIWLCGLFMREQL